MFTFTGTPWSPSTWPAGSRPNVAVPDAEHAPIGQMIRMRTYPAVDNRCCAAPNADTLHTEAWLEPPPGSDVPLCQKDAHGGSYDGAKHNGEVLSA
jgi:hypothetical protein